MYAQKTKPHIVILGGGFGGIYTYKHLMQFLHHSEANITLINRTNYFLFTPMLHEVATGGLAHHQVVESLRELTYKTHGEVFITDVHSIDLTNKIVHTHERDVSYDYLVVATGATTNFFGTKGAQEHSLVLKDLRDAIKIRNRLIDVFEQAAETDSVEERKKILTFAVVGGGATGVETVMEVADLFFNTFYRFYKGKIACEDVTLSLVNRDGEILKALHPYLRRKAEKIIRRAGVKVMLNKVVTEVTKEGLVCEDGEKIAARNVIWTAGVSPQTPDMGGALMCDPSKRIMVDKFLHTQKHPEVFALGDVACVDALDGKPLPMLAQVAVNQAPYVAWNITAMMRGKKLAAFSYQSKGELVSVGRYSAVARIFGISFSGPFAWFIWRTVYLFKFISHSKKLKIAVDWTTNLFFPRDITRA